MNTILQESKRIIKKSALIARRKGVVALCRGITNELRRRAGYLPTPQASKEESVSNIVENRFYSSQRISFLHVPSQQSRINIVTDSTEKDSLFGGVATALILGTLYANKNHIPLRIITRASVENPRSYFEFLKTMGLDAPEKVEFFSDSERRYSKKVSKLEISEQDIFLATSWWSARAIHEINLRERFFYVLQEVETFFYPNGDDQMLCEKVLSMKNIRFIVNSRLLMEYYSLTKKENIVKNGISFEPSFPKHLYAPNENTFADKVKKTLFFYSRPNNPRNLFYSGIELLDRAILKGIIDTKKWDIYFAGSNVQKMVFCDGTRPKFLGSMTWESYANFAKTVDLALCLMYTPHPSYPPLDLAASGAVVLTNSYANKTTLDEYSKNIICTDLRESKSLCDFERAMEMAGDSSLRQKNYKASNIQTDWEKSFEKTIAFMRENE